MLCEQAREHLSAYLDKELTADLSAAVRAHLDTCPDCRRLFEDLRATADLLARLPVRAAPEGLAGDVMREMQRRSILGSPETAAGQPHERTLAIRRARPWPRALAVAATLLLAALIGLFAYLGGRPGSPAPSVELGLRSPEKTPAAAIKSGDSPALPSRPHRAGRTEPDAGAAGGAIRPWHVPSRDEATGSSRSRLERHAAGEEQDGATRLGTALTGAPTAGLANVEDVAGRQAIFGNEMVVRSAPATQRPGPARGTVHDKGLTLAWFGPAKGGRLTPDGYGYTSNGSVVHYFGTVATAESRLKKLAPPDAGAVVTGAVARTDEKLAEHGAAAAGLSGPAMVQQVMNYVAEGQAPVGELKAVATRGNLDLAENQLVVRAASRDEANKELVGLFGANGWEALPQEEASAYLRDGRTVTEADGDEVNALGVTGTAVLARKSARRRAAGWYFRAGRNGQDTWVILTDRDNLSRFGGQLAQARVMTVGSDSSEQFRAIERLQHQLRAQAVVKADVSGPAGARARSRTWGKAARETAATDSKDLGETKDRAIRAAPDLEPSPKTQVVRGVPAEKAPEAETARILGDKDAERMARQRGGAFRSSTAAVGRGAKRPAEGGTLAPKPPITLTDDEQDAKRPKPADDPEAVIPETPAIAMHDRPPTGRKKAPAGPAAGLAAVTPAKPSVSTPVEPPAPAAKPSISALAKPAAPPAAPAPVMKAEPAAGRSLEEEEAPADTAVALRGADERRAGQRKDAILKEKAKAEGKAKRWHFAERPEADKLEKAGAMKRKPAKPTVTFGITAGDLKLRRVLVLPKNQVLLVVRVRQAAQGAGAAGKPVAAEAEEGQRSVGEK